MSKVVNAIVASTDGRKRIVPSLFGDVFSMREEHMLMQPGLQTQYRIEVKLGSQCWVDSYNFNNPEEAVALSVERTKRQVIEAIFGEFREDFRMIERSLYDRDIETARVQFHDMEKKMFEVTE